MSSRGVSSNLGDVPLELALPSCDGAALQSLANRRGIWPANGAGNIGRKRGVAVPVPGVAALVPPTRGENPSIAWNRGVSGLSRRGVGKRESLGVWSQLCADKTDRELGKRCSDVKPLGGKGRCAGNWRGLPTRGVSGAGLPPRELAGRGLTPRDVSPRGLTACEPHPTGLPPREYGCEDEA
jgi:hypothetical protein